jgi:NAD(P)-dependent dehydrogenase (short-subunit alcohol dehydrogenase family)
MQTTAFSLSGKTIFVTGASSGIGRQVCVTAAQQGAKIVLSGRNEEELQKTLALLPGHEHLIVAADLTTIEERENLLKQLPQLDGMVYCAGGVKSFPIRFLSEKRLDEMQLNFDAPAMLTAGLLRLKKLNREASLVYLSSISSNHPPKGGAIYGASKAALESYVKVLARETAPQLIRANCISPGMVKTPLYDRVETDISKEEMDKHIADYPLGAGLPEDVAYAAVYLLSPASRWVTGINLILDGGFLLGN